MGIFDTRKQMVRPHGNRTELRATRTDVAKMLNAPSKAVTWVMHGVSAFFRYHVRALWRSVHYIRYEVWQFAPACLGMGLILALPLLLYTALLNVQELSVHWRSGTGVSAYLRVEGNQDRELEFITRLNSLPEVSKVLYRSSKQALAEFRNWSGLSNVLDGLSRNPLPSTLEVYHQQSNPSPEEIELLRLTLDAMPEISVARANLNWLSEYYRLYSLFWQILWIASIVVLSGAAFAIAFSIRLMITNRHEEIRVTKLMGGSDSYIARPFMYIGFCYGTFSTLAACLLVAACRLWLDQPFGRLVDLYGSDFQLRGLGFGLSAQLLLVGGLLGMLGARFAVGVQLKALQTQLRY